MLLTTLALKQSLALDSELTLGSGLGIGNEGDDVVRSLSDTLEPVALGKVGVEKLAQGGKLLLFVLK